MFYKLNLHEAKRKCTYLPLSLGLEMDDKECCLFLSPFPLPIFVMAADYQFWKVPATPRTWSVHAKVCLLSSGMFEWFSPYGWSYWNFVLACFEDFACVPCCRNDNDVTSYEGPQKLNSFGRYFNQIYWDKLLNKLIITVEKKSLLSTLAILAQIVTRHGKKFFEISF